MDCVHPHPDDHLEADYEDRQNSGLEETDGGSAIDPELEAWLLDRIADFEEQRFALADQFGEEWRS